MYLKYREKIDLFMEEFNMVWQVSNSKDEEDSESEDESENDESDTEEMEGEGDCDENINEEENEENGKCGTCKPCDLKSFKFYNWILHVVPEKMLKKFEKELFEYEEPEYYKGDLKDCLSRVQRVKKKWKHCGTNQFYDCSSETINAICKCFYDIDGNEIGYSEKELNKIARMLGESAIYVTSLINPACSMDRKRNLLMKKQVGKHVVSVISSIVIPKIKLALSKGIH